MNSRRGSASVEAALVFPLIILIAAALISIGSGLYESVKSTSLSHMEKARQEAEGSVISAERIMRGRWIIN